MKINKSRHRSSRNTSRRKYKNINKSRKRIKKTHKKYLVRLKKYNKNIRHRKYYTRKVNRYKRGGAELQPITAEFNFSFPMVDNKITDLSNYNTDITILAGGWGYVTKAGLLHRKNRPEQLIVYKQSVYPETYFIARCTYSNCRIARNTLTESHMEKPIIVSAQGFTVTGQNNKNVMVIGPKDNRLTVTFKNDKNESYTIEVVRSINTTNNELYELFYYISQNPQAATSARVALGNKLKLDTGAATTSSVAAATSSVADNTDTAQIKKNLIPFRRKPALLAVLVGSIARSKDKTRDIDICFKIISNHILPLELVVVDSQTDVDVDTQTDVGVYKPTIIEKQFATMLYYLCKETIKKITNKTKDTIGLAISKDSNLFTKLVTYYSLMRGKFFLDSILTEDKLKEVIKEVQTSKGPDQTTMINFAISILVLILDNIKELPIGFKCISAAIYNELGSSHDIAFIQAQILNLLCIKLISPFIVEYFKEHFNLFRVVYFMQKIATNNNDFPVTIDSSVSASLDLFHEYANKQLSEENLHCDVLVDSDTRLLDKYSYNLEQSALTFKDLKDFEKLITLSPSSPSPRSFTYSFS